MAILIAVVAVGLSLTDVTHASPNNWPQWRGPNMMSVVENDPNLPETWSATQSVAWKTAIPGVGWSSPIVWGNKVFLTAVVADTEYEKPAKGLYLGQGRPDPPPGVHHWMVYCVDLQTGKILWQRQAHEGQSRVPRHPKNSYSSETPTTDGERVYVLFGDIGLFCYDMEGKPVWSHAIEYKPNESGWGPGSSPVLLGNQLIHVYDNTEESYIAAYDTKTGKQNWRTERDEGSTWATPFIWKNDLRTEIVTAATQKVRSYDPSGKLLWYFNGRLSRLTIPTPFAAHGMVYISSGYPGDDHRPVYAVRPGGSGNITPKFVQKTNDFIAWYQPKEAAYNPSAIVYGDYYYTLLDGGFITAHSAKTGEEVYGRQRIETGATFTASPWAYNGKIFCLSEDGNTYVIEAGPKYNLLGKNVIDEMSLSSPAIAQERLLIRTAFHLYCIKKQRI